mgnify:CR=1 FL=1
MTRSIEDIEHIGPCAVKALAHALSLSPDAVYQGMRRDMRYVMSRSRIKCPYLPPEIFEYLFARGVSFLPVEFQDDPAEPGVHYLDLGVRSTDEVVDWIEKGKPAIFALNFGKTGHWIGFDGYLFSGLNVPDLGGQRGFLTWGGMVEKYHFDHELTGVKENGEPMDVSMAILIDVPRKVCVGSQDLPVVR